MLLQRASELTREQLKSKKGFRTIAAAVHSVVKAQHPTFALASVAGMRVAVAVVARAVGVVGVSGHFGDEFEEDKGENDTSWFGERG